MNVLRSLTFSVALCGKFATFSDFEKIQELFWKTHLIFCETKANFWTFWETLFIHSQSTVNLLPVAFFQNFSFLFENPICSLWKKDPNFPLFWKTLAIQSRSTANLLLLAILKTLQIFFRKTQLFFKSPNFERFRKS